MNLFASWNIEGSSHSRPTKALRLYVPADADVDVDSNAHADSDDLAHADLDSYEAIDHRPDSSQGQSDRPLTGSPTQSAAKSSSAPERPPRSKSLFTRLPALASSPTLGSAALSSAALSSAALTSSAMGVAKPLAGYSFRYGKQVFLGIITAARKWHADEASTMAAGVAYYLALSLFPMLLLLTAGLGLVFRYTSMGHDAEVQILAVVAEHCSPTLEQQVREVLSQLREQSLVGGPFGLFTATLAAIGVFYRFERSFDKIWRVKAPADANWWAACVRIVKQRLSAFCLLTSLGLAIVMILLINVAVGFVHAWMSSLNIPGMSAISAVDACVTLLLNAFVFGLLYRFLPKRRIEMLDAFRGGLLAALVWELGRQLLGAVLIGVRYTAAYGAIGSFIALLLWCYWGVSIIFFGAEYAQVLSDERHASNASPKR